PSDVAAVEQPVWPAGAATPLALAAGAGGPTATPAPSVSHGVAVALEPPPPIGAAAYAVVERECGALLWRMNETQHLPPASLTKIVTALVVMDSTALDEVVQSNVSAQELQDRGSSVMGLEPGDSLSVLDLLNGMLLESGNDAALVLAQHAAGSVD